MLHGMLCACPAPQGARNLAARLSPLRRSLGPLLSRTAGLRGRGSSWVGVEGVAHRVPLTPHCCDTLKLGCPGGVGSRRPPAHTKRPLGWTQREGHGRRGGSCPPPEQPCMLSSAADVLTLTLCPSGVGPAPPALFELRGQCPGLCLGAAPQRPRTPHLPDPPTLPGLGNGWRVVG